MSELQALRLTLLGRPECGLCEEMALAIHACAETGMLLITHADVDSRADWQRRYGLRIPILLDAWGEVICEGQFDPQAIENLVREHRRRPRD